MSTLTVEGLVIPAGWRQVLRSVQEYFPQANIAGGALRDLYHGKPAKDVDIFVPLKEECDSSLYEDQMLMLDPYAEKVASSIYGQSGNSAQPGFRNIYVIWRLTIDGEIYEVIFIEDRGEDIISVFDLSIAQIGYDGKTFRATENFRKTVEDKIIRVCNQNRADRQTKRLERVLSKYPEYTAEEFGEEIPFLKE